MAIFQPQPQFHDNILQSVPQLIDAEMQDMEHTRLTRAHEGLETQPYFAGRLWHVREITKRQKEPLLPMVPFAW
ncbi:hypothetical protein [Butyricicoccus intestinisimiae]|uniref:Uncharacterized protein n=1 Tax=Butyricicoccus intestinisimiae TaxID=2841509 RepID=A0ABS6EUN9_9FIRM|nr:hypothetical protein [Butyricicoccus intestinisimiae]MBU5491403.1 hypothetical protein [Butyricicoccus intestinisimiae]